MLGLEMLAKPLQRHRLALFCCLLFIIFLGLASRKYPFIFPSQWEKYPGDALWSMMVYVGVALLRPTMSIIRLAGWTLLISYLDEFSQLIQHPVLNQFRHTTIGHLLLGTTFLWNDLWAYMVGVLIAILFDLSLFWVFTRLKRNQ